jgi:peroxiredoxin
MSISVGDKLPELTLKEATPDGMNEQSTSEIFGGKKVVLFAVPGTCSNVHVPGYLQHRDALLEKGIDEIAVLSVNDGFVMGAWAKNTGAEGKIRFLADWDGAFTKAVGQDIDLSAGTLGVRSRRYSMLVDDGVVRSLNVEEAPGAVVVSGPETILEQL